MRKILGMLAFAGCFAAQPALAAETDMSTITCKQLLASPEDEISYILMWVHGYYGGKADDTTVDLDAYLENAKNFGGYCAEHPDIGVLSAVKQVLGE